MVFTANFLPWPVCLTALGFAVLMGKTIDLSGKTQLGKGRGREGVRVRGSKGGELSRTIVCMDDGVLLW